MKINNAVYQGSASYKLLNTTFAAIVNEAFIEALPFNRYELTEENERSLSDYAMKVVESYGGFDSLTYAMQNEKDPAKKQFLSDIRDVCLEATASAVSRVSSSDHEITQEDMVAPTLDKKEYKEYVDKADKLDLDRVAEIVKKKVLDTLEEERKARLRNDEVNQALKEAIQTQDEEVDHSDDDTYEEDDEDEKTEEPSEDEDSDSEEDEDESEDSEDDEDTDESEEDTGKNSKSGKSGKPDTSDDSDATESFLDLISGSRLCRPDEHKSFFNSILNRAMEQIITTENVAFLDPDEISKNRILDLTLESTLPNTFATKPNASRALEFVMNYTTSQKLNKEERQAVVEAALVDATIAYTMLSTLHTMNLIKPGVMDIRTATEAYAPISKKYGNMKQIVATNVVSAIRDVRPRFNANKYEKIEALESGIEKLTKLNLAIPENDPYFDKSHLVLSAAIENMQTDLNKLNAPAEARKESWYEKRAMENYRSQMDKIAGITGFYGNRVHKIVLEHYAGKPIMDVKLYGAGINPIMTTHVAMEGFNGGANELMMITHGTKLDSKSMPSVFYKEMDGRGREIMIR